MNGASADSELFAAVARQRPQDVRRNRVAEPPQGGDGCRSPPAVAAAPRLSRRHPREYVRHRRAERSKGVIVDLATGVIEDLLSGQAKSRKSMCRSLYDHRGAFGRFPGGRRLVVGELDELSVLVPDAEGLMPGRELHG
jgi:hypothetical protein